MTDVRSMARATPRNRRFRRKGGEDLPEWLPRATEFSDDPELLDPVWVIEQVARFPQIFDDLREETDLEAHYGRKRVDGNWALIMLAFVLSNNVDVEPFCRRYRSSPIWSVAGFTRMPSVQTVWARLTELEKDPAPFVKAANKLIQQAIKHEPRIIENVWVDATSFEPHAALEHCCESRSACIAAGGRPPRFVKRAGEQLVEEERHRDAAEPPNGRTRASGALEEVPGTAPIDEKPSRRKREYRYFMIGKHRYRTLDPDAGARTYKNGRTWFGGYNQSAISMFVGAPLANNIFSASENEHTQWPKLLKRLKEATGGINPQAAIFDRGYSIESTFELNTREGISSIMPFRQPNPQTRREDLSTEAVDMHGVPRCKHCGGPGDQDGPELGFYFDRGVVPRIRFRCELQLTPACKGKQSIACEESWRLLLPTSRFTRRYHALKKAGENKERNWLHWRARYKVAGKNLDTRPKRPGLAWQELRASAALLLEWFRLCLRHGWLGSHRRRNHSEPVAFNDADRAIDAMLGRRRKMGLDLPYGRVAAISGVIVGPGTNGPPPGPPPPPKRAAAKRPKRPRKR